MIVFTLKTEKLLFSVKEFLRFFCCIISTGVTKTENNSFFVMFFLDYVRESRFGKI